MISWEDFTKVEMRVGTVIEVDDFPKAMNPSYRLKIDFGNHGLKKSSAQITDIYSKKDLLGRQVIAVTNFPAKQIADFMSECLVLGIVPEDGKVILLRADKPVKDGLRIK